MNFHRRQKSFGLGGQHPHAQTPPQRPEGRWRPYGNSEQDPAQGVQPGLGRHRRGTRLHPDQQSWGRRRRRDRRDAAGRKMAEARVIGTDPETDLAVLHVASLNLQPIVFADPAPVQVGDIVLAVEIPSASARQ